MTGWSGGQMCQVCAATGHSCLVWDSGVRPEPGSGVAGFGGLGGIGVVRGGSEARLRSKDSAGFCESLRFRSSKPAPHAVGDIT